MDFLEKRSDESIRKELRGIRDSYHHYWDLLAELLQNSRDAINRKRKLGESGPFFIVVTIDATTNTIAVQDNGTGIPKLKIHEMLAPGGGDKDGSGDEVGEKGVGLTYAVFSGNCFEIKSRVNGGALEGGIVEGAQNWLNGVALAKRPEFTASSIETGLSDETEIDGTKYSTTSYTNISVGGILAPENDISFFSMTAPQLKLLMRTRTSTGVTRRLFNSSVEQEFDTYLSVHLPAGNNFEKLEAGFLAPHQLIASSRVVTLDDVRKEFISKSDSTSRKKYLNGRVVWDRRTVKIDNWNVDVYGAMLTDNDAFKQLSKDVLGVTSSDEDESIGMSLFQSGIYVGTKGMPTGMRISPKPGGRYPAYYKRCFFFVESPNLKFDLGRKSLHYKHIGRLQLAVGQMFDDFEQIAQYQGDTKVDSGVPQKTKAERSADIQAGWAAAEALPELGETSIPYLKHPNNQEAAVAAVFHELLGAKVITGYQTLSTGYSTQYDVHALYTFPGKSPSRCMLEFKHDLESLIRDLNEKQKHFQEIDILVAWDASETKLKAAGFSLSVATVATYNGVTHMLTVPIAGIDEIPVILLKYFIDRRNANKGNV